MGYQPILFYHRERKIKWSGRSNVIGDKRDMYGRCGSILDGINDIEYLENIFAVFIFAVFYLSPNRLFQNPVDRVI